MSLLQQLDMFFSVANGLVFVCFVLLALMVSSVIADKKAADLAMLEEAHAMNDDVDFTRAMDDEAEAIESGTVVNVVGYCLCKTEMGSFKPFKFTTVKSSAEDCKFLDMVACSHCEVCNPDGFEELSDDYEVPCDEGTPLTVVSESQVGERVTFTFDDGSTAIMRAYTFEGYTERHLDAPFEGGYRVDNMRQVRAIDTFTGGDCIPF